MYYENNLFASCILNTTYEFIVLDSLIHAQEYTHFLEMGPQNENCVFHMISWQTYNVEFGKMRISMKKVYWTLLRKLHIWYMNMLFWLVGILSSYEEVFAMNLFLLEQILRCHTHGWLSFFTVLHNNYIKHH